MRDSSRKIYQLDSNAPITSNILIYLLKLELDRNNRAHWFGENPEAIVMSLLSVW